MREVTNGGRATVDDAASERRRPLYSRREIRRVRQLARAIHRDDHGRPLVVVGALKGLP